jgi:competence protein ComEC
MPRAGWLAVGAIVAALLAGTWGPGGAIVGGAAGMLGGALAARGRRVALAALLLGLGSIAVRVALAGWLAASASVGFPLPVGPGEWAATVRDISAPKGSEQRAFVEIHDIAGEGSWLVYSWLPRHPAVLPGDRIIVRGRVSAPPKDAAGFVEFLDSRGATGTLKAHTLESVGDGGGAIAFVERLRWAVDASLSLAIPEPEAGLASGILVGLRERVGPAVADDFLVTGLTHVVAISGWNIALVAGIATAMLRAAGLGRRGRSLVVMVAIVAYTVLAGADTSVVRAAAMGGVVIVARESGRPAAAASALALATWGLLLAQPDMITDIGLQLSIAATAGLLALGGASEAAVRRATLGHGPRWFHETLGVSLAAQLATLPLILFHFGRLSVVSPLANLVVAPIVPWAMAGAAGGVLLGPIVALPLPTAVLAPIQLAAWLPLAAMTRGAAVLAQVPYASVELPGSASITGTAIALTVLVTALHRARGARRGKEAPGKQAPSTAKPTSRERNGRRRLLAVTCCLGLLGVVVAGAALPSTPVLRIAVLDVGQGDAVLLETADGSRALVDGGPDPDLLMHRLDERIPIWDRRIDVVILTHPHEDHAGGLAGLMPRYRVGRIVETGMASDGSGVRELRARAARHGVRRVRLVQGDHISLGRTRLDIVWPPRALIPERAPSSGRAINDTSIVLVAAVGSQRALLTGDLEEDRDLDVLDALPPHHGRWDLLKVAHHGSATASSEALLEGTRPRLAVISSGADNRYGHPAPSTLERLDAVAASVWRTDRRGTASISLDGHGSMAVASGMSPLAWRPRCAKLLGQHVRTGSVSPCYARADGSSHPHRSALTAHVRSPVGSTAPAYDRRGRGGLVPGIPRHASRHQHRSASGRDRGPTPRRRQGAPARAPPARPRTRQHRRRLAERGRAS